MKNKIKKLKDLKSNLQDKRNNTRLEERNNNIDLLYKIYTKEEIEYANLSMMMMSILGINKRCKALDIKRMNLKLKYFAYDELGKIGQILCYVDGLQHKYESGTITYMEAKEMAFAYVEKSGIQKQETINPKVYIKK